MRGVDCHIDVQLHIDGNNRFVNCCGGDYFHVEGYNWWVQTVVEVFSSM